LHTACSTLYDFFAWLQLLSTAGSFILLLSKPCQQLNRPLALLVCYQPRPSPEVYYRHDRAAVDGPLKGASDVYLQGSFNRWKHPNHFGPTQMQPAPVPPGGEGAAPALVAKVWVPEDAHVMDFVFTDAARAGAGRYDSQFGLDYHAPVWGGVGAAPSLRVVHVAVEMAPIAKVGGMGDVVTALCRAVIDKGHSVEVILPKYDCMDHDQIDGLQQVDKFRSSRHPTRAEIPHAPRYLKP